MKFKPAPGIAKTVYRCNKIIAFQWKEQKQRKRRMTVTLRKKMIKLKT